MAEGQTIGTAYVQIEPSFDGVTPKIDSHFGGEGEKAGNSFSKGFASVAGVVGKAMVGAVAAGGAAVGKMVQSATASYGEFEQLEGGAKLMFGGAYDYIADKASTAFKDIQMSQNDYLQQVNGLATGLKTALGDDEMAAAKLANKVVKAEADVVAATGNSQEAVQNAFNGIMKSNFTMLDNLQLGITPTKAGMQEVIDKVNEWNASNGTATSYMIDNLADCQSALVDYIAMQGIADYAADEGADTLQGATSSMKAAWDNLLTGMANPDADVGALIENLVGTAETFAGQLMPIVEQALTSVSSLVANIAPIIAEKIPALLSSVLPMLLTSGAQIVQTLAQGLLTAIPALMPTVTEIIVNLINMLVGMLPQLIEVGAQVILSLATGLAQSLPELIPSIVNVVLSIVEYLLNNIDLLIDAAAQLMIGLAVGLVNAIPVLIEKVPMIITQLALALIGMHLKMAEAGIKLVTALKDAFVQKFPEMIQKSIELVGNLKQKILEQVVKFIEIGFNIVEGIKQGIADAWEGLVSWFSEKLDGLVDGVKNLFGIHSPSRVFAKEVGQWIPAGIAKGVEDGMGVLDSAIESMTTSMIVQPDMKSYNYIPKEDNNDGSLYALLAQYLPQIASGSNVQVGLEGDAKRLFRVVISEGRKHHELTGDNIFLMQGG